MSNRELEIVDRREPRFDFGSSDPNVLVRRQIGHPSEILAIPLDISHHGVKLRASHSLLFEEPVELEFRSRSCNLNFRTTGEVRWIRNREHEGTWIIGCRVEQAIPTQHIEALAKAGNIERRLRPRIDLVVGLEAQLAGTSERIPVTVLDYSDNGVRLLSSGRLVEGQKLKLFLYNASGREVEILTTVRWTTLGSDGYSSGCEVSKCSLKNFRRCLKRYLLSYDARVAKPERDRVPFLLSACVALFLMFFVAWCTGH